MRIRDPQRPFLLSATMLPLFLGFASLILIQTRSFSEATEGAIDASNVHKVIAVALLVLVAGFSLASRGLPRRWPPALVAFACYVGIGFVSTVNSQYLVYSYWKLAELTAVLLLGLHILRMSRNDPSFALQSYELWLGYLRFLVIATLIGAAILPSEALRSPVTDETIDAFGKPLLPLQLFGVIVQVNANSLGAIAAILLYVDFTRLLERRRHWNARTLFWVVVSASVLVLAQSRTAWVGFAAALVFGIARSKRVRRGTKVALMAVLAAAAVASVDVIVAYMTRGASTEHLSRLSGRASWWEAAIGAIHQADLFGKLFGLGFMSANRALLTNVVGTEASTLHSDYMDALVSTGFVGVTCFLATVLLFSTSLRALLRRPAVTHGAELAGIGFVFVVRSFTGTTFAVHNHFIVGFVTISVLAYVLNRERARSTRPARSVGAPGGHSDGVVAQA